MQNKFTIGQMSKLHNISIKTLRYYDEIGLFTPFEVDHQTGYRYYTFEQFKLLDIICYLKMMGVPLREIKKKVEHSSLDDFIQILSEYQKITEEKINELQRINDRLKVRMGELEGARMIDQIGRPFIKAFSDRVIIEVKERVGTTAAEIESVLRELRIKINHITPLMIGKVGFILSIDHMKKHQFNNYDGIFLLVEEHIQPKHELMTIIPGGTYAVVYMREKKEEAVYYDALLKYIHQQGYQPAGPFFVRQIVDSFISHNEEEWLREIQIQIKPLTIQQLEGLL